MPVHRQDGMLALDRDEYPRPATTAKGLAGLKPSLGAVADMKLDEQGTTCQSGFTQAGTEAVTELLVRTGPERVHDC